MPKENKDQPLVPLAGGAAEPKENQPAAEKSASPITPVAPVPAGEQVVSPPQPQATDLPAGEESGRKLPIKPTIIFIIALATLVATAIFFATRESKVEPLTEKTTLPEINLSPTPVDPVEESLKKVSSSDEITSIEKDLAETDLENIDSDLGKVESQL